jgi:hypothetical protein
VTLRRRLVELDVVRDWIDERIRVYRLERDRRGASKRTQRHSEYVVTAYQALREEFVGKCLSVETAGEEVA